MDLAKVTSKGQLTIPIEIRKKLMAKPHKFPDHALSTRVIAPRFPGVEDAV